MFNNLTEKLNKAFHTLKGHGKITEINVAETLKEVRRALLDADVSYKIAKDFTKLYVLDADDNEFIIDFDKVKDRTTQITLSENDKVN